MLFLYKLCHLNFNLCFCVTKLCYSIYPFFIWLLFSYKVCFHLFLSLNIFFLVCPYFYSKNYSYVTIFLFHYICHTILRFFRNFLCSLFLWLLVLWLSLFICVSLLKIRLYITLSVAITLYGTKIGIIKEYDKSRLRVIKKKNSSPL